MTDVRELDEIPELLPAAIDLLTKPLTRRAGGTLPLGHLVAPRSPLTDARFLAGVGTGDVGRDEIPASSGPRRGDRAKASKPTPRDLRCSYRSTPARVHDSTRLRRTSVGERRPRDPAGDAAGGGASLRMDGQAGTTGTRCRAAIASRRLASGEADASAWCRH